MCDTIMTQWGSKYFNQLSLSTGNTCFGAYPVPDGYSSYPDSPDKFYKLHNHAVTFEDAELICEYEGAALATFEAQEDLQAARGILG